MVGEYDPHTSRGHRSAGGRGYRESASPLRKHNRGEHAKFLPKKTARGIWSTVSKKESPSVSMRSSSAESDSRITQEVGFKRHLHR
jgi:hypothetical protein